MPRDLHPGASQVEALLEAAGQAGRYQAVSQVGAGGIGVVFKATDRQLKRAVAIKAVHSSRLADPRHATRLRSEALAAASLDHPYICKIYELIEAHGEQLIVMEFVEGETLAKILSRGVPPLAQTLRYTIEIAEGLANAHEHGLVHRDLKPGNVMVTSSGHIKLLDFGLARVDASSTPDADTRTPALVTDAYAGTPFYMAPEQAAGQAVTRRTDVFSLGVVLFQCVTGHLPFEGPTPYGYISNLLAHAPTPLYKLAPDTPADLARLIDRCLEKTPARRPESAAAVVDELRRILNAWSSVTGAGRSVQAARTRVTRRLLVIAAVLAVVGFAVWRWRTPRDLLDVAWQTRQLLTSASEESESRISPDGQWIAFLSTLGGTTQLMVRRMEGGETRRVATGGTPESHAWSPDGSKLAYVTRQGKDVLLQVVPAFSGGVPERSVPLTPPPANIRVARWIGQTIYVETRDGARRSLRYVNLGDGTYTNVSEAWTLAGTMTGVDVSSDGRRVVYGLSSGGQEDLWVANIDGTSPNRLTTDQYFEHDPLWTSRDASVIYQSNRGGQIDLWEVGVESRRTRSLTLSQPAEEPESTSADGRFVSFRHVSETSNLWTWSPANAATQLTDDALGDFSPTMARGGAVVFQRSRPSLLLGNPLSDSTLFLGVLEGSKFRSAPTTLVDGFAARLSPDGARLAYLQRNADPQRATLVIRDLQSGATVQVSATCPRPAYSLVSLEWVDQNLTWNAAGTDLYFVDRPDGYVVRRYRVGAAAAEPPLATAGVREVIQDLHLSADGRRLAYIVSGAKGASRLHLVDADSGVERSATPLEGPVSARGWRLGDAGLVLLRRTRVFDDATSELDVLEVSTAGRVRSIGRLDHALLQTVRLDRSRSAMYVVRSQAGVHNVYEYSLAGGTWRRITDNARPGVTFSGVEPLREGAMLGVRLERRSDIWLLDATPPPGPPRR